MPPHACSRQATESIDEATALLKAVANDNRLRILCLLDDTELSVTELNRRLALSQSALSQHLAILRREELVTTRRSSQTIFYSLRRTGRALVETWLACSVCERIGQRPSGRHRDVRATGRRCALRRRRPPCRGARP
ncbi:ArsR family transcriptional regulator [Billgrantia gudaonensis]|uniref:ArsR family transcriptional regulator n=1 Tax=Billgrantia gudaonensis TaxID=376427 RepID=A0A3S0QGJ8_9GAMM|nr:ArsR family transcriptional regulator [Halomonas gudaonensis]